jgi:hypothetical protein
MPILTPTKDTGGVTKALPGIYAEPSRLITDEALGALLADTALNGAFIADLLSAMLTHERCGRHLYRSCEGRTINPVLQTKYREFGSETEHHVEVLEGLVVASGGNPAYASPMARAVEGTDSAILQSSFMLRGSVDLMTAEMVMLDAVLLAESMDHANWHLFSKLAPELPPGDLRDRFEAAAEEVEPEEDEHLSWAKDTKERLTLMQVSETAASSLAEKAEELSARVKNWFAD